MATKARDEEDVLASVVNAMRDIGDALAAVDPFNDADEFVGELLTNTLRDLVGVPVVNEERPTSWVWPRPYQYWLLDPICGTRNYRAKEREWAVQAALMESGKPILSAVYSPRSGKAFTAVKGKGAYMNGEPIQERQCSRPRWDMDALPPSLALCAVASADFEEYTAYGRDQLRDWHLAPGHLVLTEAGGKVQDYHYNPIVYRFASYTIPSVLGRNP